MSCAASGSVSRAASSAVSDPALHRGARGPPRTSSARSVVLDHHADPRPARLDPTASWPRGGLPAGAARLGAPRCRGPRRCAPGAAADPAARPPRAGRAARRPPRGADSTSLPVRPATLAHGAPQRLQRQCGRDHAERPQVLAQQRAGEPLAVGVAHAPRAPAAPGARPWSRSRSIAGASSCRACLGPLHAQRVARPLQPADASRSDLLDLAAPRARAARGGPRPARGARAGGVSESMVEASTRIDLSVGAVAAAAPAGTGPGAADGVAGAAAGSSGLSRNGAGRPGRRRSPPRRGRSALAASAANASRDPARERRAGHQDRELAGHLAGGGGAGLAVAGSRGRDQLGAGRPPAVQERHGPGGAAGDAASASAAAAAGSAPCGRRPRARAVRRARSRSSASPGTAGSAPGVAGLQRLLDGLHRLERRLHRGAREPARPHRTWPASPRWRAPAAPASPSPRLPAEPLRLCAVRRIPSSTCTRLGSSSSSITPLLMAVEVLARLGGEDGPDSGSGARVP